MDNQYYIYILTNYAKTSFYVGVTSNLIRRVYEHKHKVNKGYTAQYHIDKLIYFEVFEDIEQVIKREKQIKAGSRQKKIDIINSLNLGWKDLYNDIL